MHSKSLICHGVATWKNYLHLLANWMHSKSLICHGVATWKNYLRLWPIECTPKVLFGPWMSQLKIITFIYWPIECISNLYLWNFFSNLKATWKKYIHLLANWMHSKCFIYQSVPTWDNYFPILANWIQSKIFICQDVPIWKKKISFIGHWMHLKILIFVNASTCKNYLHVHWPIKCTPKVLVVGMYELVGITYVCWII